MVTSNRVASEVSVGGGTIQDRLSAVQAGLKAPKDQHNSFGKYNYRTCEGILAAAKPLYIEQGCVVLLQDEIVNVGDRQYIKATARFCYGGEEIAVSAYAREPQERKGMDEAQVTGASSSYARKYALNGLFAIDDSKDDPDHHDNREAAPARQPQRSNAHAPRNGARQAPPDATAAQTDCFHRILQVLRADAAKPNASEELAKHAALAEERFLEGSLSQPQIVHIRAEVERQKAVIAGQSLDVSQTVKDLANGRNGGKNSDSQTENGQKNSPNTKAAKEKK